MFTKCITKSEEMRVRSIQNTIPLLYISGKTVYKYPYTTTDTKKSANISVGLAQLWSYNKVIRRDILSLKCLRRKDAKGRLIVSYSSLSPRCKLAISTFVNRYHFALSSRAKCCLQLFAEQVNMNATGPICISFWSPLYQWCCQYKQC